MGLLDADMFVKPVEGHDDLVAFNYGFTLEGKAVDDPIVTELDDGDLRIQGWAANFEGDDRQGENFAPGAFERGIKSFLNGQAALCYHHKHDQCIGKVLDLKEDPDKGLWIDARVDKQEPTSPLYHIYNGVRKGSLSGLSVGGFFKRAWVDAKRKIADMDFTEISVTPVPVHPGTGFSVVAGKALEGMEQPEPEVTEEATMTEAEVKALEDVTRALEGLTEVFEAKALPRSHHAEAANWLRDLLGVVGRARQVASVVKEIQDHEGLTELADSVESDLSKWEAQAHKLAAKVGPLPPPPVALD